MAAVFVAGAADAQSIRDRIVGGANRLKDGVDRTAAEADRSIRGTIDLMTDEATPDETRAKLDAMANDTLDRLFAERPDAAELFVMSAGYAVFDTRRMTLLGFTGGVGRGVAASLDDDRRIYMNMGTGGLGFSFGIGGFETQVVMLFEDSRAFDAFVTEGFDATAEAGAMAGEDEANAKIGFVNGRSIFYLTGKGWKVSATAAGTRYWADADLN